MTTKQSAAIYVTNDSDGHARIQLYHRNSSDGTQGGSWQAAPGETVGPLTVYFETGFGSWTVQDYWWIRLSVRDGSHPGEYISGGSLLNPEWKECQLEHEDAGQSLTFTVDTNTFHLNEKSGSCSDSMNHIGPYTPITNVFVLMLENHSFDNIFGMSGIPGVIGASTADFNSYNGTDYHVQKGAPVNMPTDPGHEFTDVVEQLAGQGASYPPGGAYPPINNSGFASNYATTTSEGPTPERSQIGDIMAAFDTAVQLPVIYQLACEFAICDQWFSSLPGPTWPNRFFIHGASSSNLDHSPSTEQIAEWESVDGFSYPHGSLYDALNRAGIPWRIYNDDKNQFTDDPQRGSISGAIPQVSSLKGINLTKINSLSHFSSDLQGAYAYPYTFIEPNYGDIINNSYAGGSSQHPMDDVYGGENLIKFVYESIRSSPLWNSSLLVIVYDEHGGFYDSVAPGPAPSPDDGSSNQYSSFGFNFEQYGVRVPAVVVSPLIQAGTVDHTLFDHASVPATVERLFGLPPLTQRDAKANDLRHLLTLTTARSDCPTLLNTPAKPAPKLRLSAAQKAEMDRRPLSGGNFPGFLSAMLKTELELSSGSPEERARIIDNFKQIKNQGDAKKYIENVMHKVAKHKAKRKG